MASRGYGTVKDIDHGWEHIKRQAEILKKQPCAVIGVRGQEASEKKRVPEGEPATDITLVEVATFHEYGAPNAGIPERSFIRSTVDENIISYREMLANFKDQIFKGTTTVRAALLTLGLKVQTDIRKKIRDGIPPPWAESTREKRIARAKGKIIAETPLIDTGQLVGGITHDAEYANGGKVE